jgi:predicted DNA-binding protein
MNAPIQYNNHPGRKGSGRNLSPKTIRLDREVYKQLLIFARERRVTLSSVIREALDRHVAWMKGGEQ